MCNFVVGTLVQQRLSGKHYGLIVASSQLAL